MPIAPVSQKFGIYDPIIKGSINPRPIQWYDIDYLDEPYRKKWAEYEYRISYAWTDTLVPDSTGDYNVLLCFPIEEVIEGTTVINKALIQEFSINSTGDYDTLTFKVVDKDGRIQSYSGEQLEINVSAIKSARSFWNLNLWYYTYDSLNEIAIDGFPFFSMADDQGVHSYIYTPLFGTPSRVYAFTKFIQDNYGNFVQTNKYTDPDETEDNPYDTGSLDFHSDVVGMPSDPIISIAGSGGGLNIYKLQSGQLVNLFSTFSDINDYKNYSDFYISCHAIPCSPNTSGLTQIFVADKTLSMNGDRVISDYVTIDCGSIYTPETYKSFLDYENVTIKVYLPFIGYQALKPEWVYDSTLSIQYKFNVLTGDCIACIFSTLGKNKGSGLSSGTMVAQYSANCSFSIPLTASNYSRMFQTMANGAMSFAGSVAGGAIAGGAYGAAIGGAVSLINTGIQASTVTPDVVQSGSISGSASFMSFRTPFLYFEWVRASMPSDYQKRIGMPSNIRFKLGDLKGFTVCNTSDLSSIPCTSYEQEMIAQYLQNGIYL